MKTDQLKSIVFIVLLAGMLINTLNVVPRVASEDIPYEVLDAIGTHFELQHFNIFITTNTTVHIILMASSEGMGYLIENADMSTSTLLTLGTLEPLTNYYMYEDSYINEKAFMTDDAGHYTYTQDLSQIHHVSIQSRTSTIYINKNTTLQSNIYDEVVITADNIILDLNGYNIIGSGWAWAGVDVYYRENVTIKNGGISNFYFAAFDCVNSIDVVIRNITMAPNSLCGIYLSYCTGSVISNNTITSDMYNVFLSTANFNTIVDNIFTQATFYIMLSSGNVIYHNNFINCGVAAGGSNTWDDGYPSGGNYWSGYTGVDLCNGPDQDIPGSDGIGDTPYTINANNIDHYPLMNAWSPTERVVKIGGEDESVTIVSNTAIGTIVANKNNLKFTSSGLTGQNGYINLILPMYIVTADIKVSIDNKQPASPFPIINTDGTNYFIYFEFPLSTHIVTVQFAPSITAIIDIDPNTLNLKSNGEWITGYIELTEEYDIDDIDVSTIMLNNTIPAELCPTEVGDHDNDGVFDLMVKFNRTEVSNYISEVQDITYGNVILTIKGEFYDGTTFEGNDTIRVRMPGDVDCNGKVDVKDVSLVARNFGSGTYNIYYDMNEDGTIDVRDLATVCKNFGKEY